MSDLFHQDVPDWFIFEVFDVMYRAHWHTFQILTKRPERMREWMTWYYNESGIDREVYKNVWLGVSVENQRAADERIPLLLQTPAAVRFLSCEPLLGPVDLSRWLYNLRIPCECGHVFDTAFAETCKHAGKTIICPSCRKCKCAAIRKWETEGVLLHDAPGWEWRHPKTEKRPLFDWVIVGGESGPGARPMHPDWVRSIRDQCQAAGVAFHFKHWGEWSAEYDDRKRGPIMVIDRNGKSWNRMPALAPEGSVRLKRVGKKTAGRLLDGRTWDEFPVVVR